MTVSSTDPLLSPAVEAMQGVEVGIGVAVALRVEAEVEIGAAVAVAIGAGAAVAIGVDAGDALGPAPSEQAAQATEVIVSRRRTMKVLESGFM